MIFFVLSSSVGISICVGVFGGYGLVSLADLCFTSIMQSLKGMVEVPRRFGVSLYPHHPIMS